MATHYGQDRITTLRSMYESVNESRIEAVRASLGYSHNAILSEEQQEYVDGMGFTLLHRAIICNASTAEVINLLNDPAEVSTINVKILEGCTALYFAIYVGHTELVKTLLDKGAVVTNDEDYGKSELMVAICRNRIEIAKILIDHGCLVNVLRNGWTPLHLACYLKLSSVVRLLLENGANVDCMIGEDRYTPVNLLHKISNYELFSFESDNLVKLDEIIYRCLKELLRYNPNIDTNHYQKPGNPPAVSWAFNYFLPKVFLTLINNGAKPGHLFERDCGVAFCKMFPFRGLPEEQHALAKRRYLSCLYLLLNHGIEPSIPPGSDKASLAASILLNQLRENNVDAPEAVEFLEGYCYYKVQTLKEICRPVVRRCLGHPLVKKVSQLYQLPEVFREYLLFEGTDFDELE